MIDYKKLTTEYLATYLMAHAVILRQGYVGKVLGGSGTTDLMEEAARRLRDFDSVPARIKSEGCAMHPDEIEKNNMSDDYYARQLRSYYLDTQDPKAFDCCIRDEVGRMLKSELLSNTRSRKRPKRKK